MLLFLALRKEVRKQSLPGGCALFFTVLFPGLVGTNILCFPEVGSFRLTVHVVFVFGIASCKLWISVHGDENIDQR